MNNSERFCQRISELGKAGNPPLDLGDLRQIEGDRWLMDLIGKKGVIEQFLFTANGIEDATSEWINCRSYLRTWRR